MAVAHVSEGRQERGREVKEKLAVAAAVAGVRRFECEVIFCRIDSLAEGLQQVKVDGEGRGKRRRGRHWEGSERGGQAFRTWGNVQQAPGLLVPQGEDNGALPTYDAGVRGGDSEGRQRAEGAPVLRHADVGTSRLQDEKGEMPRKKRREGRGRGSEVLVQGEERNECQVGGRRKVWDPRMRHQESAQLLPNEVKQGREKEVADTNQSHSGGRERSEGGEKGYEPPIARSRVGDNASHTDSQTARDLIAASIDASQRGGHSAQNEAVRQQLRAEAAHVAAKPEDGGRTYVEEVDETEDVDVLVVTSFFSLEDYPDASVIRTNPRGTILKVRGNFSPPACTHSWCEGRRVTAM